MDSFPIERGVRLAWYFILGLMLSCLMPRAFGATAAPTVVYSSGGYTANSVADLAAQKAAALQGINSVTCSGVSRWRIYFVHSVGVPNPLNFEIWSSGTALPCDTPTTSAGGLQTATQTSTGCVPPMILQGGNTCTDAKLAGGACNKGALDALTMPAATFNGATISYQGCEYMVVSARNNCSIGGVPSVCGVFEATGSNAVGGVGSGASVEYTPPGYSTGTLFQCPSTNISITVNGVNTCTAPSDAAVLKEFSGTQTVQANGDKIVTVETTKTTGSTATTTTAVTTTPSGGSPTTSTTQNAPTSVSKAFCEENPTATICTAGTFTGNCASGFSGTGDPATVEMAKDQLARNCALFDTANTQSTLANLARVGSDPALSVNPFTATTEDLSANPLDQTGFLGSTSCPADKSVAFVSPISFTLVLPFSRLCDALQMAGAIAVAFSLLMGGFIVFRGV